MTPCQTTNTNNSLIVSAITDPTDLRHVAAVMNTWRITALEIKNRSELDPETIERLSDSVSICIQLSEIASCFDPNNPFEIFAAQDEFNHPQAVMSICLDPSSIHIMDLVTNPTNLIPGNTRRREDPEPVRGAAKALMKKSMMRALELNKSCVSLDALPLALGFYRNLGFECSQKAREHSAIPMHLTAQKIIELHPDLPIFKTAA